MTDLFVTQELSDRLRRGMTAREARDEGIDVEDVVPDHAISSLDEDDLLAWIWVSELN